MPIRLVQNSCTHNKIKTIHNCFRNVLSKKKGHPTINYDNIILKILKVGTLGKTTLAPIVHQKNCILVTNNNTYIASQMMKAYFVDLFFHPKFHVVCNQCHMRLVQCDY
jgi:hypothetical protein